MTDTPAEREEGIWTGLRRRKVVQWTVAYAAGAWVLLQVLEYFSGTFDWPRQIQQLTTVALLIGLPVAVVLAWFHGERAQQRVSGRELALLTVLLLVGGGLLWWYAHRPAATPVVASAPSSTPTAHDDARPSIAVLPFDNRSKLDDDAYFVDGIHDDILTQLSKVSALRVISRTSVERFRESDLSIQEIAQQLGVKSILEGGVQRAGDRVRINVQLIDAGTDAHLWAESYDRQLTAANIFAIQSEVATAIAGALKANLREGEKARVEAVPTQNLEAWEAYQLGKQRTAKRTSAALVEAEQHFRNAIELDPGFSLAYAGLADAVGLQVDYSGEPSEATLAEADKAASRSLELDPDLAEAWAAKGHIAIAQANWSAAERYLKRAIELNPNHAPAHHWLSMTLGGGDRVQEELEHAERAVRLDPLWPPASVNLGYTLEALGRFDEAARRYRRAMDIDPLAPGPLRALGALNAYARNRFTDAVPLLERAVALDSGNPRLRGYLAYVLFDIGDTSQATLLVAASSRRWPDDGFTNSAAAGIAAALGDNAAADRHANKALTVSPPDYFFLRFLRNTDLQRGDPGAARARYAAAFPELLGSKVPRIDIDNYAAATDLALVLQNTKELDRATALLDVCEQFISSLPRLGLIGYEIYDVQIHALRGDTRKALAALRDAETAGWRGPLWRYYRDAEPALDSIRNDPKFKAVFADIERDMARQRAALAARPKDAPLDLAATGK